MNVRYMYKIHCLDVAAGNTSAARGNNTFYETEQEALDQARSYVNQSGRSMVVYRAAFLVERVHPPVEVTRL